ncbi:hypothetical protein DRJ48_01600 [Candidatus Woesearchaeota archaeon]|nr:hypothetical protein [Candidatus Woesearchaeota archaeon]RLE43182.1 MAG: hypothetical protein DRJ48_01600 [Candidatus Woesearchaeota archaeon]
MGKKCIICGEEAKYQVKHTNNYYCENCAKHYFSDTKLLIELEQEAQRLKQFVDSKLKKG